MKKIAIIGGGIVGSTAAYYLSREDYEVTLYEDGTGQATRASAGIICPWFSLRRNKPWYYLVSQGAEFYKQFMSDLNENGYKTEDIYQIDGALMIRKTDKRVKKDLEQYEAKRHQSPSIGKVHAVDAENIPQYFPLIHSNNPATWVEGGGRVHGDLLINTLHQAIEDLSGTIIREKAHLNVSDDVVKVSSLSTDQQAYDAILLAAGPGLPGLLNPLGYSVDIRSQKGQLFVLKNDQWKEQHWPVIIPTGQGDIIPFNSGEIIVGATHEDDQKDNLDIDLKPLEALKEEASQWMPSLKDYSIVETKVGTRAHTSDYSVLVGAVPQLNNVWAISGLGSSGLTSGPFLGYQWAQLIHTNQWNISSEDYPIEKYIHLN
ncbi:NAD(P)/FAD-dependent oxidoreductase [Aerococcaceae bacterium WGS1372]